MKKFMLILFSLSLIVAPAYAEELTQQKKEAIDELLEITGAAKIGLMMGNQIIAQMATALKKAKPDIDPRAFDIIKSEVTNVMNKAFVEDKALNKISYPIYHKYLQLSEIQGLLEFYKTPLGKKAITVMPTMTQESMVAGARLGQSLGPVVQKKVLAALKREGIELH